MTAMAPDPRPQAFAGSNIVAIVPITDNWDWVRSAAWRIAETAAATRPPVTLIDLCLSQPVLDAGNAGPAMALGIVDAFEEQLPLDRVVSPQPLAGLHYISVGRDTAVPSRVWRNERWKRLSNGFKAQDALLILLVPPSGVPHLATCPDAIILLTAEGRTNTPEKLPAISPWIHQNVPIVEVITHPVARPPEDPYETQSAGHLYSKTTSSAPVFKRSRSSGFQWKRLAFPAILAAAAVVIGMVLAERGWSNDSEDSVAPNSVLPGTSPENPSAAAEADSLFYSLQLAVYNSKDLAADEAIELARRGFTTTVAAVRIGSSTWHRVLFGAVSGPEAAEMLLRQLWRDGLVEEEYGTILRTPQALRLGTWDTVSEADLEADRLRDLGFPAYVLPTASGTVNVLIGAFENGGEAARAESLLVAEGITATTITRTGISP